MTPRAGLNPACQPANTQSALAATSGSWVRTPSLRIGTLAYSSRYGDFAITPCTVFGRTMPLMRSVSPSANIFSIAETS